MPLVDEPIGELVASIQAESEEIAALVASPRRQLAFMTFAHVRIGLLLGELLVDLEEEPADRSAWVQSVLAKPENRARVEDAVLAVAREVAADPQLAQEDPQPDPGARERLRSLLETRERPRR